MTHDKIKTLYERRKKNMKKRKKWYRILSFVLTVAMLAGFCPQGVSFKGMQLTTPKAEAADAISNPKIEKVTSMNNTCRGSMKQSVNR